MTEQERIEEMEKDIVRSAGLGVYEKAKYLTDLGYQKVPDGSVVLTKEEYERFKTSRNIRVVTKYEEDDYEVCIPASDYDEIFKQVRKEMAKDFAEKLKSEMLDREYNGIHYKWGAFSDNDIDELLKEYER